MQKKNVLAYIRLIILQDPEMLTCVFLHAGSCFGCFCLYKRQHLSIRSSSAKTSVKQVGEFLT